MESLKAKRIFTGIIISAVIFLVAAFLPEIVHILKPSLITHPTMLVLSLIAIFIFSKGNFKEYGFTKGKKIKWLLPTLIALGLGAIATLTTLLLKISGIQMVKSLSFPEIILYVWIIASLCEEVLTRGFLQSFLQPLKDNSVNLLIVKVDLPAFIAALFFSLMHLVIIKGGADFMTVVVIMIFTFCVGILAGHYRSLSGSLIPAVVLHMLANMGGLIGGIIYGIIKVITTGMPPGM